MYYRLACMLVGYCPTEIFWVGFTIWGVGTKKSHRCFNWTFLHNNTSTWTPKYTLLLPTTHSFFFQVQFVRIDKLVCPSIRCSFRPWPSQECSWWVSFYKNHDVEGKVDGAYYLLSRCLAGGYDRTHFFTTFMKCPINVEKTPCWNVVS